MLHGRETSCEPDINAQEHDRQDDVFKKFEVIGQLLLATSDRKSSRRDRTRHRARSQESGRAQTKSTSTTNAKRKMTIKHPANEQPIPLEYQHRNTNQHRLPCAYSGRALGLSSGTRFKMIPKSACTVTLKPHRHMTSEHQYHQHSQTSKKQQTHILADVNVALNGGEKPLHATSTNANSVPCKTAALKTRIADTRGELCNTSVDNARAGCAVLSFFLTSTSAGKCLEKFDSHAATTLIPPWKENAVAEMQVTSRRALPQPP